MQLKPRPRLTVAVIGSGVSGLAAAWLLDQAHDVTVYELDGRAGGHAHTVDVASRDGQIAVDTGFIVYNPPAYPNLVALFDHLGVPTKPSEMSFSVSLADGALEYSGTDLNGLFAQRRNVVSPRFWSMLRDLRRFYRDASAAAAGLGDEITLGDFLQANGYGPAFRDLHLLPMAAAIWSAPAEAMLAYPARAFIRFFANHGLLRITGRPQWRTVVGGSREYVARLTAPFAHRLRIGIGAAAIERTPGCVAVRDSAGGITAFDHVVVATHADDALRLLADPSPGERDLLAAFAYARNVAVLHSDPQLMPRRTAAWSSWNYVGDPGRLAVTYWMNRLQGLPDPHPLFVTLNPMMPPRQNLQHGSQTYSHPLFSTHALAAQRRLWSLQGERNTWFCGAYFGAGFHEDGLQSGLAVAEQLGGVPRPWRIADPSGRIHVTHDAGRRLAAEVAA